MGYFIGEDRKKVVCFGDSNTYGANGFNEYRFPPESRWPDIIAEDEAFADKYEIVNMGENGREIPEDLWKIGYTRRKMADHEPIALIIVMLGTNDMLTMFRSGMPKIAARMDLFIRELLEWKPDPKGILLVAPVHTELSYYGPEGARFDEISLEFREAYSEIAAKYGLHFADAADWKVELGPDGVHFTDKGHRNFAKGIKEELKKILLEDQG